MKLLVVSSAPFITKGKKTYAYGPYVKELLIWQKYATEISFCCSTWEKTNGLLIDEIPFEFKKHYRLIDFNLNSFGNIIKSIFCSILNALIIFNAMYHADHIHLRCPGNIGLLGCFVQILFPNKIKSAKYAGNWDPKSKQPWTYRLQKYILANTFLTRNIEVLVYGDWDNQSKNIKPFFTATYLEAEKELIVKKGIDQTIEFVFVGSLVEGKNPMYAVKLIEQLVKKGNKAVLNLYGEGIERDFLENYIEEHQLQNIIILHGNQDKETLKKAYQENHFVILPSRSEGWPKAVAEGMFWGCVPVATKVSCVPFMLDYGERGILLTMNLENDLMQIQNVFRDKNEFLEKSTLALQWSRNYTTDVFESEIKKILIK